MSVPSLSGLFFSITFPINVFQISEHLFTKLCCDTFRRTEGNLMRRLSRELMLNMSWIAIGV